MSVKVKNRHRLKNKDIKFFNNELSTKFCKNYLDSNLSIEIGNIDQFEVIIVDNEMDFILYEGKIFFTLHGLYKYKPKEYFIVVDMGAVGFVTKGADIMAPGIRDADLNININDFVWICDETHHKPLAIGKALMIGEDMINKDQGKAIKNIHYVGDNLWNYSKQVKQF